MAEEQINWKHTSNDSNAFKCNDSQIAATYTNMKRIRKPYTLNTVGGTYLSIDSSQTDTIRSKAIGNAIIFENMVLKFFKLTSSSLMSVSFRSIIWSTVDDHHPNNNDWESQVNLHFIPFSAAFEIIKNRTLQFKLWMHVPHLFLSKTVVPKSCNCNQTQYYRVKFIEITLEKVCRDSRRSKVREQNFRKQFWTQCLLNS